MAYENATFEFIGWIPWKGAMLPQFVLKADGGKSQTESSHDRTGGGGYLAHLDDLDRLRALGGDVAEKHFLDFENWRTLVKMPPETWADYAKSKTGMPAYQENHE